MKRNAALLILIILVLTIISISESISEGIGPTNGTCGTDLTWSLQEGVLTITGTGTMSDYATDNAPPWEKRKSQITEIVIGENITTIGDYAFYYCDSLEQYPRSCRAG